VKRLGIDAHTWRQVVVYARLKNRVRRRRAYRRVTAIYFVDGLGRGLFVGVSVSRGRRGEWEGIRLCVCEAAWAVGHVGASMIRSFFRVPACFV